MISILPAAMLWLGGCASLSGDWEGSGSCSDAGAAFDWVTSFALEASGGVEFAGDGRFVASVEFSDEQGGIHDGQRTYHFDVLAKTEAPMGEQDVDIESEATACDVHVDGVRYDPDEFGFDCEGDDVFKDWDFVWDGGYVLEFEADYCDGEIERDE
jgi:hypothetical protein